MPGLLWSLLAILFCAATGQGQEIGIANGFPYTIDPTDTSASPYLPSLPTGDAGAHGFLGADGEGNYRFDDGTPARFFGTTFQWGACFPDSTSAVATARHLRKLGVNLVRFQNMDNAYDWGGSLSILDPSTGFRSINPAQARRFDWLLYQLKKNGIYSYLMLQSARVPRAGDGLGSAADSVMWLDKSLNFLYPQARQTHKLIAQLLLEHVNPFTGVPYKNEPAVAMIEMLDQGSLLSLYRLNQTEYRAGNTGLSWRNARRLDTLFARYLGERYGSDAALASAWNVTPPSGGYPNLISEGSFEGDFESAWDIQGNGANVSKILTGTDSVPDGELALTLRVRNAQGDMYGAFMRQMTTLKFNTTYTLTFTAKCSNPEGRRLILSSNQTTGGGLGAGLYADIVIPPYWKEQTLSFIVPVTAGTTPITLYFWFGDKDGDLKIDDVKLTEIQSPGLLPGESIASATISRIPWNSDYNRAMSSRRIEDQTAFYMALEGEYYDDIRRWVRDSIGARQPLTGAANYWASGYLETATQGRMDFTTVNQGWNYITGDNTNWQLVDNSSPLRTQYAGMVYEYSRSAHRRQPLVAGFSIPFPNRYQAEGMMMIPTYSLLQEWDGVIWDSYDDGNRGTDRFIDTNTYYTIADNPVMISMMPALSQLYRNRLLAPAVNTITIQHTVAQALVLPRLEPFWGNFAVPGGMNGRAMAVSKVVVDSTDAAAFTQSDDISFPSEIDGELRSDTREILWEYNRGSLTLDAPRVQGASGSLVRAGGVTLRNLDITLLSENETATILWVPLDTARRLAGPGRSLLVLATRTEPTGWHWQDSTRADRWGAGPMLIEPMRVRLAFRPDDSINVATLTPLDAGGHPKGTPITVTRSGNAITTLIDQSQSGAVWYAVELAHDPGASVEQTASRGALEVYPSVIRDRAYVSVWLDRPADNALLELYDQLGRRAAILHAGAMEAGTGRVRLDAEGLPQGAYILRLRTERGETGTAKVTIVR